MGNPIWAIFWLLIFIFISFWLAFLCSFFYIFVHIFEICCSGCSEISTLLLRGVQFPGYCARAMMDGKSPF